MFVSYLILMIYVLVMMFPNQLHPRNANIILAFIDKELILFLFNIRTDLKCLTIVSFKIVCHKCLIIR